MIKMAQDAFDEPLKRYKLDAMIWTTPATVQSAFGQYSLCWMYSTDVLAAQYPQITVPMGYLADDTTVVKEGNFTVVTSLIYPAQPFGLTFAGTANSEADLLAYAYAFEQGE
jgi:amidase